jgi:lysophospholipase L1-like esterase
MKTSALSALTLVLSFTLLAHAGDTAAKVPLQKGQRIVFLGDSITAGGVGPKGYVTVIKNELPKDLDMQIIGAGISGNKVPDLQKRLDKDVLSKKPNLVVIYIGINDVWHGEKDPTRGTTPERYEEGLRDIISRCQAASAQVLLCTPTVIGELPGGANKLDAKLDEYAELSRKVAREMKVPLCDLRKAFLNHEEKHNTEKKDRGILTGDRVHLSEAGNRLVATTILQHLAY